MGEQPTPVPVTALLAVAIFEARSSLADPIAMQHALELLDHATGGEAMSLDATDDGLMVNGTPVPLEAPGAVIVRESLLNHHTVRLQLPARLSMVQWQELVELYASAPGLYDSLDDLRDALRATLPQAIVSGTTATIAEGDLRESLFELPGLRSVSADRVPAPPPLDPRAAELTDLESRMDLLLEAAGRARDAQNYVDLATVLLQLVDLERASTDNLRAIVARERRRIVPAEVLEELARSMPRLGGPAVVTRALGSLGHDGAAALIIALNGAVTSAERRIYIDALVNCRDCDDAVLDAMGNPRYQLVRDAAEIAGRKHLERAVPLLGQLLKHRQVEVRTAAWHSLELIGTREARRALGN